MMASLRSNGKTEIDIVKPLNDELEVQKKTKQKHRAKRTTSNHSVLLNNTRRKIEDKMAKLFMWIVVVFILCHFPRYH